MEVTLASPAAPVLPTGDLTGKPKNPAEAAQQFESLLLTQMLRAAHATENQEDPTADTMWDMAAQQFAQVLSKNGGLGLARMIQTGLEDPHLARKP
jgi:Rod binding domain-containing protein